MISLTPLVKSEVPKKQQYKIKYFSYNQEFGLESGDTLPELRIAYTTHGELNEAKDNVVWVFHALTANADPIEWWGGLVGENKTIDPAKNFIVCANILGSCYGSSGPDDISVITTHKYGLDFPLITIKDMVKAHQLLKEHLGISKIFLGIGGSVGGQQLLEWAITEPDLFVNICALSTNASHSPWGIAFNAAQRLALEADPTLKDNNETAGEKGLKAARAIAMLSYRNQKTYEKTQSDNDPKLEYFKAESYQRYQGEKLVKRFSPYAYWTLSKAMDSHNVGRGKKSVSSALKKITANSLIIGIKSDLLFPVAEQRYLVKKIKNAELKLIDSVYGHDGFLIEVKQISKALEKFLTKN